ncbi:DUF7332 family protein [Halobacterium wangiae]|uniref:DUF7332 family protein n=1 Tax=Halobacterium wangiae TaxID=2902623 RepID=UPI001E36BEC5|nr:hypothetical protein [Halobacterium wangiae]
MSRTRSVGVVLAAMVVLSTFVGGAAAGPPVEGDGGHRFDLGGESPHITFWLHFDLLTNLGAAGDFGFSAVGTAMDIRVVVVDVQLQFDGVGPLGGFLSDPLSQFSITAEWELNLPFLATGPAAGEDFNYEDNRTIDGSSR